MPRPADNEHVFLFFRAQFVSELPLLDRPKPDYAHFLQSVLLASAARRKKVTSRHWSVGNLEIKTIEGTTILYGRIGRLSQRESETYLSETLQFNPVQSPDSHSVSFVFESEHEFVAIESSGYIGALTARKNLMRLFNEVDASQRDNLRLSLPAIEDFETAFQKLRQLKSIKKFSARLRKPNPNTNDVWEEFYENIHAGSGADREKVDWQSDAGKLNPDLSTPIGKAIQMSADAYGEWEAVGRNSRNRTVRLKSGQNIVARKIDISNPARVIASAVHYFKRLFERTSRHQGRRHDESTDW